ncbi:leucine-rich repeat domain-containing protein [Tenacibaculum sp. SZ-18]|uniref:leucine-rich repeat domain-containing protein n=1 Tax=Tenacibaculum sp. SZ-18 TaxID=754423 RepID=UPI0012FD4A9B|nr:hypothetical protein [Tenacibaculum sp. SZ-18]
MKILKIQFSDNISSKLPENIGNLQHLKKLHILNTYFKEFPKWIFKLKKLENLMLRGNEIDTIPPEIKLLKHLKHFRFENTNLNNTPIEIRELKKLETLSFADNFKLKNFNESIINGNLKMLALTPSSIERKVIDKLKKEYPNLKIGKRYFK